MKKVLVRVAESDGPGAVRLRRLAEAVTERAARPGRGGDMRVDFELVSQFGRMRPASSPGHARRDEYDHRFIFGTAAAIASAGYRSSLIFSEHPFLELAEWWPADSDGLREQSSWLHIALERADRVVQIGRDWRFSLSEIMARPAQILPFPGLPRRWAPGQPLRAVRVIDHEHQPGRIEGLVETLQLAVGRGVTFLTEEPDDRSSEPARAIHLHVGAASRASVGCRLVDSWAEQAPVIHLTGANGIAWGETGTAEIAFIADRRDGLLVHTPAEAASAISLLVQDEGAARTLTLGGQASLAGLPQSIDRLVGALAA